MTTVRKTAMGNYLSEHGKGKEPRKLPSRPKLETEGSVVRRWSVGSQNSSVQDPFMAETTKSNEEDSLMHRGQNSRAGSATSTSCDQYVSSPEMQMVGRQQQPAGTGVLFSSLFCPMRKGPLVYDLRTPGPFVSIGKALDPFQTMFQASDPVISVEELKHYCSRVFGTRAMGLHWIPLIMDKPHTFLSTLCIASAHRDASFGRQVESTRTTALRQEIIHFINRNICDPGSTLADHNIIALLQLITSEVIAREEVTVGIHEKGLATMIEQRGGLNQLGTCLASTISWVALEAAIIQEATPRTTYTEFCISHSRQKVQYHETIPESPVYCPRRSLETIKRSNQCDERTKELINDVREMIGLFLQDRKYNRPNSSKLVALCKKMTNGWEYPSTSNLQMVNVLTARDWKYEAIRITAIIQATAILKRTPFSETLKHMLNDNKNPGPLYTSMSASRSDESLVSPMTNMRHDSHSYISPVYATSPSHSQYPPFFSNPPRASIASIASISSSSSSDIRSRPSIVSSTSSFSFSDTTNTYFPTPPLPVHPPYNSAPRNPTTLLTSLKAALENSNLSECWSDMAGVLLWIALTVGAASRKEDKALKKWFSALAVRVSITLCFEHPDAIHATMLRMGEVVEGLGREGKGEILGKQGKRRRT